MLLVLGGVAIGGAAVVFLQPEKLEAPVPQTDRLSKTSDIRNRASAEADPEELQRHIQSLATILDQEILERQALAEELEELRESFANLDGNLRTRVEAAFQTEVEAADPQRAREIAVQSQEQRLLAAGFTQGELADFKRMDARDQMRQVELDDRARREGWVNTQRYYQERQALVTSGSSVRKSLGDDKYERYLFAQGRPNRLFVQSVIESSPAQRAGLQPGDQLIAYAGQRVFSNQELTELRSSGTLGEPVVVDIIRDGRALQISMPRGPMGVNGGVRLEEPRAAGEE